MTCYTSRGVVGVVWVASLGLLAATMVGPAVGQENGDDALPLRFTAVALSNGGPRTAAVATRVEVVINRWSTDAESKRLTSVLAEKGGDAVLEALRALTPVGSIATPGNLAYDFHYASHEARDEGGRRIFLATDRPVSYWEAVNRPRVSTIRSPSSRCT